MAEHEGPGLLRFVLERLADEKRMIMHNTPLFLDENQADADFRYYMETRNALLGRVATLEDIVRHTVSAMREEQGWDELFAHAPLLGPVTTLGTKILKQLAECFAEHADYREDFAPE
jgi:hypothetical protein